MLKTISLVIPVIALSVSACLPRDPSVGTGPIELSRNVQRGFETYQAERGAAHFAIAVDGSTYAYNYCSSGNCLLGSKASAIYQCEKQSNGTPCKIYGAKGQVVWNTEIPADS